MVLRCNNSPTSESAILTSLGFRHTAAETALSMRPCKRHADLSCWSWVFARRAQIIMLHNGRMWARERRGSTTRCGAYLPVLALHPRSFISSCTTTSRLCLHAFAASIWAWQIRAFSLKVIAPHAASLKIHLASFGTLHQDSGRGTLFIRGLCRRELSLIWHLLELIRCRRWFKYNLYLNFVLLFIIHALAITCYLPQSFFTHHSCFITGVVKSNVWRPLLGPTGLWTAGPRSLQRNHRRGARIALSLRGGAGNFTLLHFLRGTRHGSFW